LNYRIKNRIFAIFLVIICSSLFGLQSNFTNIRSTDGGSNNKWTIMAYLSGDNNLEDYAYQALNMMEKGKVDNSDISIIALIDQNEYFNESTAEWNDTRIYEVKHDINDDTINSELLANLGESDLGNQETLIQFLNYSFINYPAEKYMFIGFNHGGGLSGWSSDNNDTSDSKDCLTMWEFRRAFEISESIIGRKIDIITLMACNMAYLEIAYELRNVANYYVAEQYLGWGSGFNWKKMVKAFEYKPSMKGELACKKLCGIFRRTFANFKHKTTISAIKLDRMNLVFKTMNEFTDNLSKLIDNNDFEPIIRAIDNCNQISYSGIDICSFLDKILYDSYVNYDYPDVKISGHSLLTALRKTIIVNKPHFTLKGKVHGLNIYFPFPIADSDILTRYDNSHLSHKYNLQFCNNATWPQFLNKFYEKDSDRDRLMDWFEYYYNLNPFLTDCNFNDINDLYEDFDNDGLNNYIEFTHGTNPYSIDTDNDELTDQDEIDRETCPFLMDSDFDTVPDGIEIRENTNPLKAESQSWDYDFKQHIWKFIFTPIVILCSFVYGISWGMENKKSNKLKINFSNIGKKIRNTMRKRK